MDPPSDEDEVSTAEAQAALLRQMRELRATLEREDGALHRRAEDAAHQRSQQLDSLGRAVASIIGEVASALQNMTAQPKPAFVPKGVFAKKQTKKPSEATT